MNGAKRLKGWKPVEKMIEEWLVVAEHEQAMIDQYESEEQFSSASYSSSCESVSSSPRMMHQEPAVRNIYNQQQADHLQVTMHSNVAIPEYRQDLMYEAHPAPAFAAPYGMPYQDYYYSNSFEELNSSAESWNY